MSKQETIKKVAFLVDVDGTLYPYDSIELDMKTQREKIKIRKNLVKFLEFLKSMGVDLYCWSGGGKEYAEKFCKEHGLDYLFDGYYTKEPNLKLQKEYDITGTLDDDFVAPFERKDVNLYVYQTF